MSEETGYFYDKPVNNGKKELLILLGLVGIVVAIIGIIVGVFAYKNEVNSVYQFGASVTTYPELKSQAKHSYPLNENSWNYCWQTEFVIDSTSDTIKIQHLVRATEDEIRLHPIVTDNRFLMTSIIFDSARVVSVTISSKIDGKNLEASAGYFYQDTSENKSKKWKLIKADTTKPLYEQGDYEVLEYATPFPDSLPKSLFKIEKDLFSTADQKITIVYLDKDGQEKTKDIAYELEWYKFLTGFNVIMQEKLSEL